MIKLTELGQNKDIEVLILDEDEKIGRMQISQYPDFIYLYTLEIFSNFRGEKSLFGLLPELNKKIKEKNCFGLMYDSTRPDMLIPKRAQERYGWQRLFEGSEWYYYDSINTRTKTDIQKIIEPFFDI